MTKGSYDLEGSSFLHRACMNKNVTLEIVQYLLDLYPSAMKSCLDVPDGGIFSAYPLHLACYNEDCPNEVIEHLLEKLEETKLKQLKTNCYMDFDWGHTDMNGDTFGGTPIHYYLSRRSNNFDINIVEQLVTNPRALLLTDENTKRTPIHIIINNKSIGDMFDVVKYLVETNPTSLQMKDQYDQTPLHIACANEHMTAKTIELLLRLCPDSINEPNNCSWLPIHCLCEKHEEKETQMDDEVAMEVLKLLLDAQPDLVTRISERDDGGELPLHKAAYNKSPAFCKVLVDAYPESLRRVDAYGSLPFHHSCNNGRPDTVEYLFGLYPESINIRSNSGYLPIHKAANRPGENTAEIVEFLLRHDPECLSKPVVSNNRGSQYQQGNDALPLHIVCPKWDESNVTEHLFDLYPEAILIRNGRGKLPADVVREKASGNRYNEKYEERLQEMAIFLSTQEMYAYKAQDKSAMRTLDGTGFLPLHNALYASAPLGAIKLLIKGNPDAIKVPDGSGKLPYCMLV